MKKENREINQVQQLEQKQEKLRKISASLVLIMIISCLAIVVLSFLIDKKFILLYFVNVFFWIILHEIINRLYVRLDKKIEKLKILKMENIEGKGNLKDLIIIKDKKIINEIMTSIIKEWYEETGGVKVEISLRVNPKVYPIYFSEEEILSKLDRQTKKEILKNSIDSIIMKKLDEETMKVEIKIKGVSNVVTRKVDTERLINVFEFKE